MLVCESNLESKYTHSQNTCQAQNLRRVTFMEKSAFGTRLRSVFQNANNAQIAGKLGLGPSTIVNYMAGRIPEMPIALKIKEVTQCDLDWLLTGDESRTVKPSAAISSEPLIAKLRTVAHEQARTIFADAEIAGPNREAKTLDLLTEFLVARSLRAFNLIESESEVMSAADHKRAQRFTFVGNIPQSLEDRIGEIVERKISGNTVSSVAQNDAFRAMIRELVQEEVGNSRKRPVYPLRVADASSDENLEETTSRKVG